MFDDGVINYKFKHLLCNTHRNCETYVRKCLIQNIKKEITDISSIVSSCNKYVYFKTFWGWN